MKISSRCVIAVVTLMISAGFAHAQALINADAPSRAEYVKLKLSVHRKAMIDGYERAGVHNPKWDEPARKLIEGMTRYFANARQPEEYLIEAPSDEQLKEWADEAVDAECEDPLVIYLRAVLIKDAGDEWLAGPSFRQAGELVRDSSYPAYQKLWILRGCWLNAVGRDKAKRSDEYRQLMISAAVEALRDDGWSDQEQRVVGRQIAEAFGDDDLVTRSELLAMLEQVDHPNANARRAWAAKLVIGKLRVSAAWDARGSGFADTVTDEGWATFHKYLDDAEAAFKAAEKLCPEFPEAPAFRIAVEMGQGDLDEAYACFNRAVANEIDCPLAYSALHYALTSRWLGDPQQILDVGMAAYRTGRYDTLAPWQLVAAIRETGWSDYANDYEEVFNSFPQLLPALREVLDNYAKTETHRDDLTYYDGIRVATAYYASDWDYIAERLKQMQVDDYTQRGAATWGVSLREVVLLSNAIHSPTSAAIDKAYEAWQNGDLEPLKSLVAKTDPTDGAYAFLKNRLWATERLEEMDQKSDTWIDLQPGALADGSPVGWWEIHGSWRVEPDGTLVGTPDVRGSCILRFAVPPPENFTVAANIRLVGKPKPDVTTNFGISPNWWSPDRGVDLLFVPKKNGLRIRLNGSVSSFARVPAGLDGGNFELQVQGKRCRVFFEDKEAWEGYPVWVGRSVEAATIAIVAEGLSPEHQIRVTGLKLKCR